MKYSLPIIVETMERRNIKSIVIILLKSPFSHHSRRHLKYLYNLYSVCVCVCAYVLCMYVNVHVC